MPQQVIHPILAEIERLYSRLAELEQALAREAQALPDGGAGRRARQDSPRDTGRLLQASETRFRAFMDNNPAVAFIKDASGRRVYLNRRYRQMFQRPGEVNGQQDSLLGKTDYDLYPLEVARRLGEADQKVLASGDTLETIEAVPTPDGVMRHWLVYKFPLDDPSGRRLVGGVAMDITAQKRTEEALRRARDELELRVEERTANLQAANERLQQEIAGRELVESALRRERQLLQHLLSQSENDRRLIAYEIHDGLVQYVAAALMRLEVFGRQQQAGADRKNLELAQGLLSQTLAESRRLISGLRPPILDEAGVVAAIDYLVREQPAGCRVSFRHAVDFDRLPPPIESALFRICQEALTNARKHSQSPGIDIELIEQAHVVRLRVADQGVGFQPEEIAFRTFGLQGIRERARLLGGRATIRSAPGRGTEITVELPLAPRP